MKIIIFFISLFFFSSFIAFGMDHSPSLKRQEKPLRKEALQNKVKKMQLAREEFYTNTFIECLYGKYEITKQQGLSLDEICILSDEQQRKLFDILKTRNKQLASKSRSNSALICNLINYEDCYDILRGLQNISKQEALVTLFGNNNLTPEQEELYLLQQSRRTFGAIVWAMNEMITKYYFGL